MDPEIDSMTWNRDDNNIQIMIDPRQKLNKNSSTRIWSTRLKSCFSVVREIRETWEVKVVRVVTGPNVIFFILEPPAFGKYMLGVLRVLSLSQVVSWAKGQRTTIEDEIDSLWKTALKEKDWGCPTTRTKMVIVGRRWWSSDGRRWRWSVLIRLPRLSPATTRSSKDL